MHDAGDMELLREYDRQGSEAAFAALVQRHVSLVYSAALRHAGIASHAEEITQAVFIILARKAAALRPDTVLEGWLYETARLTALSFRRGERRRQFREQEAYMQSTLQETAGDSTWNRLAPLLDEAMARLGKKDRDAVVLRFFKDKNLREVAAALKVNEMAAQRRVHRAVEKLRRFFTKRGIILPAAVLTAAISANSVQAAPVGLAKTISAVTVAKGSIAAASTLTLVKRTMKTMTWTKMKMAIIIGVAVILAAGTTTLVAQHQPKPGLSYKMLDDACQFAAGFDQTNLVVRILITSKEKNVRPQDIGLTIQSAVKGQIRVQLGTNGQILDFPHDEALRRENPSVIHDPTNGPCVLTLVAYMPLPEELTFPYSRLGDAVAEANDGIARANKIIKADFAGEMSSLKMKVQGVIFFFPKSSARKAKVEIESAAGRREYTADTKGIIKLKLEKKLLAENPEITVSEKPQTIMPDPK